ncbi:putative DDE superfamily endonuclease [Monocercomonoides exilis]|uniref:putative DDE superfamily endonuclease n=1 Tax=Monocercomonoides exilis TaxID=2049356 RepID=UPI00355A4022|nr:putative DDE superfamily endonuclease [Monocercomonoides exilis]|eukprot:MONOS_9856.1-p1 / transcript=MONOS_9856.1 / gene=MONOS_9856 / organism=Monocercomonoides_exilis_PA203 / gene_product=unspecified product / transcript_product=unspecified product / location=Mono_scaffold00423:8937-10133(+) / protein_length=311 / sequence_SO=supercontig / SO=protein_coding / is_pseudo=false
MAMLSEDTIVRVKDIQSMCVDLLEKECDEKQIPKTVNCKYAYKLIERSEIPPSPPKPPKVPNATLCLCICEDGSSLPRFLLWPRKETPDEFSSLSAFDIRNIYSSSGWITKEIFREIMIGCWISLITSKVKPNSTKKALQLMDNHRSHDDELVTREAAKNNIVILKFPPNMTHFLQPCDSYVFSRFKFTLYSKFCPPSKFSLSAYRSALANALPDAVAAAITFSTVKASFVKTGVWPIAASSVRTRISGSPVSSSSEKNAKKASSNSWKNELFGDFSFKKDLENPTASEHESAKSVTTDFLKVQKPLSVKQ